MTLRNPIGNFYDPFTSDPLFTSFTPYGVMEPNVPYNAADTAFVGWWRPRTDILEEVSQGFTNENLVNLS